MNFAPPSADHREIGPRRQIARRLGQPAWVKLAVAIKKLHEFSTLILGAFGEPRQSRVAGAGGGEGAAEIKFHHFGPARARRRDRPIGRAAVDIDHLSDLSAQAVKAGDQPRPLVAADHDGINRGGDGGLRF